MDGSPDPERAGPYPLLYGELVTAARVWRALGHRERGIAIALIEQLRRIRSRIQAEARNRGYVALCGESLEVCGGECCRNHFPRDLDRVDLFIATCEASELEMELVARQLRHAAENRCALLASDGCVLTLRDRPIVCANAYPCFATRAYWSFLQGHLPAVEEIYTRLREVMDSCVPAQAC